LPVFMPRVLVSRFALHAGLVTFRQTFVLRCLGGKLPPAGGLRMRGEFGKDV
jgi:hypothetical protein